MIFVYLNEHSIIVFPYLFQFDELISAACEWLKRQKSKEKQVSSAKGIGSMK